jgi:hypothetical protein
MGSLNQSECSHPFSGFLVFRAPFFSDASNHITDLEANLINRLKTCSTPNNLSIQNYYFDANTYFWVQINICPTGQNYFNRSVILNCFDLNNQDYSPPNLYGPYYFTASPYHISSRGIPYFTYLKTINAQAGYDSYLLFYIVYCNIQF